MAKPFVYQQPFLFADDLLLATDYLDLNLTISNEVRFSRPHYPIHMLSSNTSTFWQSKPISRNEVIQVELSVNAYIDSVSIHWWQRSAEWRVKVQGDSTEVIKGANEQNCKIYIGGQYVRTIQIEIVGDNEEEAMQTSYGITYVTVHPVERQVVMQEYSDDSSKQWNITEVDLQEIYYSGLNEAKQLFGRN